MGAATKEMPAGGRRASISETNALSWFDNLKLSPPRQAVPPLDRLLARLDGVKRTGPGRWLAACPAHDDRRASLSVRELDDGRLLIHDFAGCPAHAVLAAVGLGLCDLYPAALHHHGKPQRQPFAPADALRCIAFEAVVVAAAAVSVANGDPVSETDRARVVRAAARINSALKFAGVRHAC